MTSINCQFQFSKYLQNSNRGIEIGAHLLNLITMDKGNYKMQSSEMTESVIITYALNVKTMATVYSHIQNADAFSNKPITLLHKRVVMM